MLAALEERARSGVRVRLIVDRYGSLLTPKRYFDSLIAAGGEVCWYQPIAWYTLKRLNNRTHRDVLVVDGEVAFVGGLGVADYWIGPRQRGRPWRDTMIQVSDALAMGCRPPSRRTARSRGRDPPIPSSNPARTRGISSRLDRRSRWW
jgi:cardiolipin synthase